MNSMLRTAIILFFFLLFMRLKHGSSDLSREIIFKNDLKENKIYFD